MKQCRTCGELKEEEAFGFTGGASRGRLSKCKKCNSIVNRLSFERWKARNPEKYREYSRRVRLSRLDKCSLENRMWKERNPEHCRDLRRCENARQRGRIHNTEGRFLPKDLTRIFLDQGGLCYYCNTPLEEDYHLDHKMPMSRGGSNWPANIAIACAPCNSLKGHKSEGEFLALLHARVA